MRHTFFIVNFKLIAAMVLACMAAGLSAPWFPDPNTGLWHNPETEEVSHQPNSGPHDPNFGDPRFPRFGGPQGDFELDAIRHPVERGYLQQTQGYDIGSEMDFMRVHSPMVAAGWDRPEIFESRLPYHAAPPPMMSAYPAYPSVDPRAVYAEQALLTAQVKAQRKAAEERARQYAAGTLSGSDKALKYKLLKSSSAAEKAALQAQQEEREKQAKERIALVEAELESLKRERSDAAREASRALDTVADTVDADDREDRLATARQTRRELKDALAQGEAKDEVIRLQQKQQKLLEELAAHQAEKNAALKARLAKLKDGPLALKNGEPDDKEEVPPAEPASAAHTSARPPETPDTVPGYSENPDTQDKAARIVTRAVRQVQKNNNAAKTIQRAVRQVQYAASADATLQRVKELYDDEGLSDDDLREELKKLFVHEETADGFAKRSRANIGLMYSYVRIFERLQQKTAAAFAALNDTNDADGSQRKELRDTQKRYSIAQAVLEQRRTQEAHDATRRLQAVDAGITALTAEEKAQTIVVTDSKTGKSTTFTRNEVKHWQRQAIASEQANHAKNEANRAKRAAQAAAKAAKRAAVVGEVVGSPEDAGGEVASPPVRQEEGATVSQTGSNGDLVANTEAPPNQLLRRSATGTVVASMAGTRPDTSRAQTPQGSPRGRRKASAASHSVHSAPARVGARTPRP